MTKEQRIKSDERLQELYDELFTSLNEALAIVSVISDELENNIQGECAEKWMAKKLFEELLARTDWATAMHIAWKTLSEKDSK